MSRVRVTIEMDKPHNATLSDMERAVMAHMRVSTVVFEEDLYRVRYVWSDQTMRVVKAEIVT